jgi:hypothetical protein
MVSNCFSDSSNVANGSPLRFGFTASTAVFVTRLPARCGIYATGSSSMLCRGAGECQHPVCYTCDSASPPRCSFG